MSNNVSYVAFEYFFSKGDHDGAIKQYIKTIGHLEPSYVIRKVSKQQLANYEKLTTKY